MSRYGVPIIRVPETRPTPHKRECSLSDLKAYARRIKRPLALDLFSGAGGLSFGLQEAGFDVILGVDSYPYAVATHRAHFGGVSMCADLSKRKTIKKIGDALDGIPIALIASGPPCQPFSRAGKNKVRSLGRSWNGDVRHELWRSFVDLVDRVRPVAILIENVPDMGFGDNAIVTRQVVKALENLRYDVFLRILQTWRFGVPQHRQRLILVGVERGLSFEWPDARAQAALSVRDAISDLPRISAGSRDVELPYGGAKNSYQRWCRSGMAQFGKGKVYDQIARAVRPDDLEAFELMRHGTLYSDLPRRLRRYRSDIFDDKYKRLPWDGLSRTITAHIGKDGYWYIHPEQHRTLSIREAARIQTFPDRFRFAGTPSHAFRQIGEAVPPLFAKTLGKAVMNCIVSGAINHSRHSTIEISSALRKWLQKRPRADLVAPWRFGKRLWHALLGTVLFPTGPSTKSQRIWRICEKRWPTAKTFVKDNKRTSLLREIGLGSKNKTLLNKIARRISKREGTFSSFNSLKTIPGLRGATDVAFAVTALSFRRPVTSAVIRLVQRFFGEVVDDSRMAAELLLGRLIGVDKSARAYVAVLEIAEGFCRPRNPDCRPCPLRKFCRFRKISRKSTSDVTNAIF
jgi:DNA (cytosine-5)-methyltransferase 1